MACTYILCGVYFEYTCVASEGDKTLTMKRSSYVQVRLEEKQRGKRHKREAAAAKAAEAAARGDHDEATRLEAASTYSPLWFQKEYDSVTNSMIHVYKGGYWEGKYSGKWGVRFPDIF